MGSTLDTIEVTETDAIDNGIIVTGGEDSILHLELPTQKPIPSLFSKQSLQMR
jgi:hypothetical protein